MTKAYATKTNFTAGELSPYMLGRSDLTAFENGAMELKNVYIHPTGGVSRRAGLKYIDTVSGNGRLLAFEYNTEQTYLLVFTDLNIDVYMDGAKMASFETPWMVSQIKNINWTQSSDTLLVVHPDVSPKKITRSSHNDWTISDWEFEHDIETDEIYQPYYKFVGADVTLTPSDVTGSITITASDDIFTEDYEGKRLRFTDGGEVEITSFVSASSVNADVVVDLETTDATKKWKEPSFSEIRGWPTSVTFHQDRLVIGGAKSLPNRIWFSKSSDWMNFDLGEGNDDECIEFSILSDQVNAVQDVFPGRHLQIFTSGGEWMVSADVLTPSSIEITKQTRVGSAIDRYVPPVDVDGVTLFASANGKELREFIFTDLEQAYQANDLATLSYHLMKNPMDQAYNPDTRLVYLAMEDGSMATMTNYRVEEITAWTKYETDGDFLSVCVVGGKTYVLVQRGSVFMVEVFDDNMPVDSGVYQEFSDPINSFNGLGHLIGNTVRILGDGAVLENAYVQTGQITLPVEVSSCYIGRAFEHVISPLPPFVSVYGLLRSPKKVRLIEARFRILETKSLEVDTGKGVRNIPISDVDDKASKQGMLLAFRNSGKSTIVGLFCAWVLLKKPQTRILVIAADYELSKKMVSNVKRIIEKHPLTEHLKPNNPEQWAQEQFTINRDMELRDPSMLAKGVSANITGTRADIIICDDVEVPNTCNTTAKREDLRTKLNELDFVLVPDGMSLYIGTPHTYHSIYKESAKHGEKPFLQGFSRLEIPIYDENHNSQWAERFSIEMIEAIKQRSGPNKFACQMMLIPVNVADGRLNPEDMKIYSEELQLI
jgi:hypothetical protein